MEPSVLDAIASLSPKTRPMFGCLAVYVEENKPFCGIGAQVASMIQEKLFDELDAPVLRINSLDAPAIYSPKLEVRQLPRPTDVVTKVLSIC